MSTSISFVPLIIATGLGLGAIVTGAVGPASAQNAAPSVAHPVIHGNLAVYFLRGTSQDGPIPLTLAEALAKGVVTVFETGNVTELLVENTGSQDVFIQAGDIVKGGQQDRVLTISLLLSAGSGRLPIGAYCVEHGRWASRGVEDVKHFASAEKSVPSREARLAMMSVPKRREETAASTVARTPVEIDRLSSIQRRLRGTGLAEADNRQGEIWANVGRIQNKLSSNLGASVASHLSASSLQLALESEALDIAKADYTAALQPGGLADTGIVGVVFAINGRISSAEVYPSHGLFAKMWPKLLDASAIEAIGEKDETGAATAAAPTVAAVADFLIAADQGQPEADVVLPSGLVRHARDGERTLAVATRRANGAEVHRTYLAK